MNNKIKVLITGGSGYIGSCLAAYLSGSYSVFTIDKKQISIFSDNKTIHYVVDLNNKKKLTNILNKIKPECIIHLAGQSTIDMVKRKNLYYKKILKELNKYDPSKTDIALVYKGKILETCTSNILFFKNREYFSPKNNCYIGNTINYLKGKIKISFKDIYYRDLKKFDEIMLIGSGKGVTSVKYIKQMNWKSKNNFGYQKVNKHLNF